jgi:two-component system response regulator CpxR
MPDEPTQNAGSRLLVIDDDQELCRLLTEYLADEGFTVEAVHRAEPGLVRALSGEHALIVLDVMLPGLSGFEVLRRIRASANPPVLMLTARGDEVDRIVGLEVGADDYLPKPFNPRELVARIRAVLRRTTRDGQPGPPSTSGAKLVVGDIELDVGARVVRQAGRPVELTGVEFDLLEIFLQSAGRVIEREELSRRVLGRRLMPEDRSIDVHVSNLRKRLGHRMGEVERIRPIRGVGYLYALPEHSSDAAETQT